MNDTINGLLKFLLDTLSETKEFAVEQAPLVVQELLRWKFYEAAVYMGAWVALALLGMTVGAALVKRIADSSRLDDNDTASWVLFARGLCCLVIIAAVATNGYTMLQVKVAPRVVVLQEVRNMIRAATN